MASGDIIQNIVLAGQEDVIAGLSSIGDAGVKAFGALSDAAQGVSISGPIGAIAGLTAAIAGITAGLFEWVEASTNATIRTANFADELGTSAGNMTTLITALAQGGSQVADLTTSFRRLAVSVEAAWPTIQKSVRTATDTMKADYIKVEEANVELAFQSQKAGETQVQDALNVQKAQLGVVSAKLSLAKSDSDAAIQVKADAVDIVGAYAQMENAAYALEHARTPATKAQQQDHAEAAASLAVQQAQLAIQNAIKKQADDAAEAELKHRQAVLAVKEAQEQLVVAQRKQAEDAALAPVKQQQAELALSKAKEESAEHQANSISNLKQYVDNLATGASNADSKVQLSSANLVKGLIASVGPGVSAVEGFKGALGDLSQSAPKLYDVMLKVADIFHNTTDETLRAAVATALFGRGYSFSLVESLSQGSAALRKAQDEIARTFDLSKQRIDEQVSVARDFRAALNSLGEGISLVSKQITTIFAPTFAATLREIETYVEANRTRFLGWAEAIRDNLTPAITGFVSSLAGINLANAFNLSPEQILKAAEWKTTADNIKGYVLSGFEGIKSFFTSTLPAAISIVSGVLNGLAAVINKVFGTDLTGAQVGITLLITQFLGINGAIIGVITSIGLLGIALAANPFGIITLAVAGLVIILGGIAIAIYKNRDAINAWIDTKVSGAFNWIKDSFDDVATAIERRFEDLQRFVDLSKFLHTPERRKADQDALDQKRAQEDLTTTNQRATRDQALSKPAAPIDESAGLNTGATRAQTQEEAWKSLGTVVQKTLDDAKKGIDGLNTSSDAANTNARRAVDQAVSSAAKSATPSTPSTPSTPYTGPKSTPEQDVLDRAVAAAAPTSRTSDGGARVTTVEGDRLAREAGPTATQHTVAQDTEAREAAISQGRPYGLEQRAAPPIPGGDNYTGQRLEPPVNEQGFAGYRSNPYDLNSEQGLTGYRSNPYDPNSEQGLFPPKTPEQNSQPAPTVPLPQPRPPEADQANAAQTQQQVQTVNAAFRDFLSSVTQSINSAKQTQQTEAPNQTQTANASDSASSPSLAPGDTGSVIQKLLEQLSGLSSAVGDAASSIKTAASSDTGAEEGVPGFAVGGPTGSGGLALLHDNEFVHSKSAVEHYGASFMHALNQRKVPKFSLGGLVGGASSFGSRMIPAYSGGGLVQFSGGGGGSSGSDLAPIHFHMDGQKVAEGMGDRGIAEGLGRFASADSRFSTGTSPSWKGSKGRR